MENTSPSTPAPMVISESEILARLQSGESREEIRLSLGLSHRQSKDLFNAPGLKNRRTIKPDVSFVIDYDISGGTSTENTARIPVPAQEEQAPVVQEALVSDTPQRPSTAAIPTQAANFTQQEVVQEEAPIAVEAVEDIQDDRAPFDRA